MKLKLGEESRRALAVFAISFVLAGQIAWGQSFPGCTVEAWAADSRVAHPLCLAKRTLRGLLTPRINLERRCARGAPPLRGRTPRPSNVAGGLLAPTHVPKTIVEIRPCALGAQPNLMRPRIRPGC